MAAIAAVVLVGRRQVGWLPVLAASVVGGLLLNVLVKHAFPSRASQRGDHMMPPAPMYNIEYLLSGVWGSSSGWVGHRPSGVKASRQS